MLITTVIQAAANTMGGGIQWSIDAIGAGGEQKGGLDPKARPILDGFVKLFAPIAESVNGTKVSTSFLPPYRGVVVRYADLSWGVATTSADDQKEYLHVLKAPRSCRWQGLCQSTIARWRPSAYDATKQSWHHAHTA
jgi:hypothetical protein